MTRAVLTIQTEDDRRKALHWLRHFPIGTRCEFKSPRRSLDQNALMWSRLGEVARQVEWYGAKLSADDWKDVFSASLRRARVVPGIDPGTYVPLGMRTSDMTKAEMTALLDLIDAFGAERGVKFHDHQSDVTGAVAATSGPGADSGPLPANHSEG